VLELDYEWEKTKPYQYPEETKEEKVVFIVL
jgi:hypothetical protein